MAQEAVLGSTTRPKIWADSVYKSYVVDGKREPVLAGVQLTVNPRELVSIIGPSGCGKSTLLNIIAGVPRKRQGGVEVFLGGGPRP